MDQDIPEELLPGDTLWKYSGMYIQDPETVSCLLRTRSRGSKLSEEAIESSLRFIIQNVQDVAFGDRAMKIYDGDKVVDEVIIPKCAAREI